VLFVLLTCLCFFPIFCIFLLPLCCINMFINRQKQSEQETTPLADSVDPVRVAAATREGWSGGAPLR